MERSADLVDEPVLVSHRTAFTLLLRLAGVASDRHTLILVEGRYDRQGHALELSKTTIVLGQQLPFGDLASLITRCAKIMDECKRLTPQVEPEFYIDVTRSPLAHNGFKNDPTPVMLMTSGMDRFSSPYRCLGRLLLLSNLQLMLRDRRLIAALPETSPDPNIVTRSKLERALSTVEARLPKIEDEELFLSDTGPDDDLALMVGLGAHLGSEKLLSAEDMRFYKERNANSMKWVA